MSLLLAVLPAALGLSPAGPLSGSMAADFALPGGRSVILYDGVCNFCNRWVNFVIDNDPSPGSFAFASMQSPQGRELLGACGREPDDLATFVLIDGDGFWTQSTAALRVAQRLGPSALRSVGEVGVVVPPLLRDAVYRAVADNRYSILGRAADDEAPSCQLRVDLATLQERMLDFDS